MKKTETGTKREIRIAAVTGATGMLGATLARVLLREGVKVYAIVRPDSPKRKNLPEGEAGLVTVERDLSEIGTLKLPEKIDAFYHFAWEGPYGEARNDPDLQDRNVQNALSALRAAKRLGAKVFLGAGSQAEYGPKDERRKPDTPCDPDTEYGRAKLEVSSKGKALARELGIDFLWLRFFSVYGPYDNAYTLVSSAIRSLREMGRFEATKGEQLWSYLYSGDAAEWVYRLSLTGKNGRIYLLSGAEERPLAAYLKAIRDAVDPASQLELGAIPYRANQVMNLSADIEGTVRDTGYEPLITFEEGIRKTIEWILKGQ